MTTTPRSIAAVDVPLAQVEAATKWKVDLSVARLQWLLGHPQPAAEGELAEYRHLLHDVDPDSAVPALNDQPGRAS
ncbi:hypothetical protein [Streptomyces sp. NPDC056723]|uniref:hypothetical protein n=1 Tax=Streptomyces sp. NPDC056723 TaxID=3345925 RepID=UPI0036C34D11